MQGVERNSVKQIIYFIIINVCITSPKMLCLLNGFPTDNLMKAYSLQVL